MSEVERLRNLLNFIYEEIDAEGGSCKSDDKYEQGVNYAVDKALAIISQHRTAIADQPAATVQAQPVAWRWRYANDQSWWYGMSKPEYVADPGMIEPLYTQPQPIDEMRANAARYEWLKNSGHITTSAVSLVFLDDFVDSEIAKQATFASTPTGAAS